MTTTSMVEPGTARQVGRYVVYDAIASGGMGTVHVGRLHGPVGFRRLVAIKRMSPSLASDPDTVRRFRGEAAVAGRVLHPSVVPTLDVIAEQGELFLVMDFVRGESLSRLSAAARDASEPVPMSVATGIMTSVLAGLHAAHGATDERGRPLRLVHRDVSPQNILIGVDGLARIADFGIAQSSFDQRGEGAGGSVRGKARYLAPEQLGYETAKIDHRVDVFSAGVVLWELLAGRPLFDGRDTPDIVEQILAGRLDSVRKHRADVPEELAQVILRALARDPAERFSSAADFARAIEANAGGLASQRAIGEWALRHGRHRIEWLDAIIHAIEAAPSGEHDDLDGPTVSIERGSGDDQPTPSIGDTGGAEAPALRVAAVEDAAHTRTLTVDVQRRPASSGPQASSRAPVVPRWALGAAVGAVALGALAASVAWDAGSPNSESAGSTVSRDSGPAPIVPEASPAPAQTEALPPAEPVVAAPSAAATPTAALEPRPARHARSGTVAGPREPPKSEAKPPSTADPLGKPYVADRP